jgi:hypothetical protein
MASLAGLLNDGLHAEPALWEIEESFHGHNPKVIFRGTHAQALKTWGQIKLQVQVAHSHAVGTKFALLDLTTEQARRYSVVADVESKHTADGHCDVDPATQCCRGCGVYHGDECPACKGHGFHKADCSAERDS